MDTYKGYLLLTVLHDIDRYRTPLSEGTKKPPSLDFIGLCGDLRT